MAYDPNDPADKAIVTGLVNAAVTAALEEAAETHEAEVAGLRAKKTELLGKLAKARAGEGGGDTGEVERLEGELDALKKELSTAKTEARQAKRDLEAAQTERDTATTERDTEATFSRNLLIENGLTAALIENKVADIHIPAVTALLNKGLEVKTGTDGKRQVFAGDKPLGEHVKEWAASEAGKHYVTAAANGGGNAGGGTQGGGPGTKKISEMTELERTAHYNTVGKEAFDTQVAAEKAPK